MFTAKDFEKMLKWCAKECEGSFMLHNYNSALLDKYIDANGWNKIEVTHRLEATKKKTGVEKVEVIVTNYSTPCGTLKLF